MVQRFAATARKRMRIDGGGYRRDHLRAFAQRVEVADREVFIKGSKGELLRTLVAIGGGKSADSVVPSSVLKWRKGWDSNPRGAYTPGGFQDRCLKPLGHPSAFDFLSTFGAGRSLKWLTCYRFATVCSRCPPLPSASIWRSAEHR